MESTSPQSNGKAKASAVRPRNGSAKRAPGARLAAAFEAVEKFPVLIESRARVMRAATADPARIAELVETVESDVGLAIAVLRFANRNGGTGGGVGSIPEAIDVLKPSGILAYAAKARRSSLTRSPG